MSLNQKWTFFACLVAACDATVALGIVVQNLATAPSARAADALPPVATPSHIGDGGLIGESVQLQTESDQCRVWTAEDHGAKQIAVAPSRKRRTQLVSTAR